MIAFSSVTILPNEAQKQRNWLMGDLTNLSALSFSLFSLVEMA